MGQRVDPSGGQRGPHDGEVARAHPQARLARVQRDGIRRLAHDAAPGEQRRCDRAVAHVRRRRRLEHLVVELEAPAGEAGDPRTHEVPTLVERRPGARLTVAIAPEFTIGFVRPSLLRSTDAIESNGRPVAFIPTSSRTRANPRLSIISARVNGLATLMSENGWSASPAACTAPLVPTTHTPQRSAGTRASAGYTWDTVPSWTSRASAHASDTSLAMSAASGRWPVEMYRDPAASDMTTVCGTTGQSERASERRPRFVQGSGTVRR